jgi:hypothetical protein
MMALVQAGVVAAQPDATHRKSAVAPRFRNAGFLQQRQRAAAGPQIDEPGCGRALRAADGALEVHAPASARLTGETGDVMGVVDREAVETLQIADEVARERTIVHVRAGDHPGRGHPLAGVAPLHHERNPLGELLLVLGIFHALVAVMRGQRLVSLFEERHVVGAADEAHMRNRMDEGLRVRDSALLHQVGP